jgi:MGT family glycosyltransferase
MLFTSAPLPGHLDWGGYLLTAAELARRGHRVLWVSEPRIAPHVERAGVPFRAIKCIGWRLQAALSQQELSGLTAEERSGLRFRRAMDAWLTEEQVERGTRELMALAREWEPDVIVGEPFVTAAALAAEALQTPYIQVGYPATPLETDGLSAAERLVAEEGATRWTRLLETFNLTGTNWPGGLSLWPQSPHLHIAFWSREWFSDEREIYPQTQFVGGTPQAAQGDPPSWLDQLSLDKPLVFITLGSTFTDDVNFFVGAAHATTLAGAFPIVAFGESELAPGLKDKLAARLPRCIAVRWVDYAHLFPRLSAIVHHGGVGTTHAAVVHGVPQVIVPHGGDQTLQAIRADANGVGISLAPAQANVGRLRQAIETALRDPGLRLRARHLAARLAALGGVAKAADWIEAGPG